MIFKALLSPKQFFTFRGTRYCAHGGAFVTDNPAIMEMLKDNPYWEAVEVVKIKKPSEKIEEKTEEKPSKKK